MHVLIVHDKKTKAEELNETNIKNDLILPHQPYHDEFLQTMKHVFKWSKWVGVVGLERFVWKLWGLVLLILYIIIEVTAIWKVVRAVAGWSTDVTGHRSVAARLSGAMFYTASFLGFLQCWRLSSAWKEINKYWASIERVLSIKYIPADVTLKKRMYLTVAIVVVCTTLEHLFNVLSCVDFHCEPSQCFRKYVLTSHGFMLLEYEYSEWIAVPLLFMSNLATVQWNLQDLLIILVSMGLTSRYRRLNECIAVVAARSNRDINTQSETDFLKVYIWRKIREAYVKQSMLVRRVDKSLGGLILLSTFFNFYFICLQLFLGITQLEKTTMIKATYTVTMLWLTIRTGYTVVAAADVNQHSTLALPHLHECNAQYYNVEIERLQKQLVNDYVALGGIGFFNLNRTVILKMSGAVVTYVLVLVQYDNSDQTGSADN